MGTFIFSYIVPLGILILGFIVKRPPLANWVLISIGSLWGLIAILKSLRYINPGWAGVVRGRLLLPGLHFVRIGQRVKLFMTGPSAYVEKVYISSRVSSYDFTGTLKSATMYVTVEDPVAASEMVNEFCTLNKFCGLNELVADAVKKWCQSIKSREELLDGNVQNLSFFSPEAAELAADWGLSCKVSLNIELDPPPGNIT